MKKKTVPCLALLPLSILFLASCASSFKTEAASTSKDLFEYSSPLLKSKVGYTDGGSGKTGLLLYGYQAGMTATFKSSFDGIFSCDIVSVKENGSPTVGAYSLTFTDEDTGKSFKFCVANNSTYSYACVEYEGTKAGISYYYHHDDWNNEDLAIGYTAGYNLAGQYTKIAGSEVEMQFDPSTMTVKTVTESGSYHDVWDFSSSYNDGRLLENSLGTFHSYTVSLTFDSVTPYSLSPLLLSSFGGYSFDGTSIEAKTTIAATFLTKAIAKREYTLPTPKVSNPFKGKLDASKAKITVYDSNKNVVATSSSFTPSEAGDYYVYYEYDDGENEASRLYKLPVLSEESASTTFSYASSYSLSPVNTFGINQEIYLPKAKIKSNLSFDPVEEAVIRIKKDGEALQGYDGVEGGFSFVFSDYGSYEISYESRFNKSIADARNVLVDQTMPTLVTEDFTSRRKGSSFLLSPGKVYVGGQEYEASATLYYPSGRTSTGNVSLDEIGRYTVEYECQIGSSKSLFSKNFVVRDENASLFEGNTGSTASYSVYEYNNEFQGVKLSLKEGSSLVYSKIVDLSDNTFDEDKEDRGENTKLIEMRYAAHSPGSVDAEAVYVVLTDAEDENNSIMIRMRYMAYMPRLTRIRAKATGQGWVGYYYDFDTGDLGQVDNAQIHEDGGFISDFDMSGTGDGKSAESTPLDLYFDNETGRLYSRHWVEYGTAEGYKDNRVSWLVRDFSTSDSLLSGGDSAWTGFKSGKVKLSIYASSVSTTADYYVMEIDGEKLTDEFIQDDEGPAISLKDETLSSGEVGKFYPYPSFTASDPSSVSSTKTTVYRGNTIVADGGKGFTPNSSGTYTLAMSATDYFGNVSTLEKKIEVLSFADPLTISLDEEVPSTASLGSSVSLPSFTVSGGVGGYTTSVSVTAGNEEVEVKNSSFCVSSLSNYVVRFEAIDYVGNKAKIVRRIKNISVPSEPVFDESSLSLPESFFEGDSYDFSYLYATAFSSSGAASKILPTITVSDGAGTRVLDSSCVYVPKTSESVKEATLEFTFSGTNGEKKVCKTVPIVKPTSQIGFLASYFGGENVEIEATDGGVKGTSKGSGMTFGFIRSLFGKQFTLSWNGAEIGEYHLILRDSFSKDVAIDLHFHRLEGKLYVSVNGAEDVRFYEDGSKNAKLVYKEDGLSLTDGANNAIAVLSSDSAGESFSGFSSGSLNFEFQTEEKGSAIMVTNIDNQIINSVRRDSVGPFLYRTSTLSGRFVSGQPIEIPEILAFDVLGNVASEEISISRDGEVLLKGTREQIGETFTPNEIGSYSITYTFKDDKGNKSVYSYYFSVYDAVTPSLTFDYALPSTVSVGTEVYLPGYSVNDQDPSSVQVYVYCVNPDGEVVNLTSLTSFVAEEKGIYTVNYYLIDNHGNVGFYTYDIVVK